MTNEQIRSICTERLGRWVERLIEQHSTPMLLIGVGHDNKSGQLTVCTLEDMTDNAVLLFLGAAANLLRESRTAKGGHL